jgi:hypothetical protein
MAKASHITLTTDAWTSRQNLSYAGYTAHFKSEDNNTIESVCLSVKHLDKGLDPDNMK